MLALNESSASECFRTLRLASSNLTPKIDEKIFLIKRCSKINLPVHVVKVRLEIDKKQRKLD